MNNRVIAVQGEHNNQGEHINQGEHNNISQNKPRWTQTKVNALTWGIAIHGEHKTTVNTHLGERINQGEYKLGQVALTYVNTVT